MNRQLTKSLDSQRGVATLAVVLLILFLVTIVTLYTANTSVMEQKVSANQYRANQAFSAANAALDFALARLEVDWGPHARDDEPIDIGYSNATRQALWEVTFDVDEDGNPDLFSPPTLTAWGYSDDGAAERVMSVRLGNFDSLGDAAKVPLVSRSNVQVGGDFTIKNLFNDDNIWSGSDTANKSSGSTTGMVRDPNVVGAPVLIDPEGQAGIRPEDICNDGNYIIASEEQVGESADILDEDVNLANLSPMEFWSLFFAEYPDTIEQYAKENFHDDIDGQWYESGDTVPWSDLKGLAWYDGDVKIAANTQIGSESDPVILIVDGDLEFAGGADIWGLLYVTGALEFGGGNVEIQGAAIVEDHNTTEDLAVDIKGTLDICFRPDLLKRQNPGDLEIGIIPGTWKDW